MTQIDNASIDSLWLYPIKGCRGFSTPIATLAPTGLELKGIGDREWVVVDDHNEFLSQRELPKMALIQTRLTADSLRLTAPGMLALDVPFESEGDVLKVRVWNDEVAAVTQGEIGDAWFSQFLGTRCRLMRFDPEARRLSNRSYTGELESPYKFADAFALLVCSTASLGDLNVRLNARGAQPVTIERFRPNIVLNGIEAFDEDYAEDFNIGSARLRSVKPCTRCTVPNVDPTTGEAGTEPGDTLAIYRGGDGHVNFGVNAVVERGTGATLSAGDPVGITLRF